MAKFGIVLKEKPGEDGLNKQDVAELLGMLEDDDEFYPVEFMAKCQESCAMGFITTDTANELDFEYGEDSDVRDFIANILDDMDLETENGEYDFGGIYIKITR